MINIFNTMGMLRAIASSLNVGTYRRDSNGIGDISAFCNNRHITLVWILFWVKGAI